MEDGYDLDLACIFSLLISFMIIDSLSISLWLLIH